MLNLGPLAFTSPWIFAAAAVLGAVSKNPPVTSAMLGVLDHDDAVDPSEAARRLGIQLTPLDETLRRCVAPEGPA